MTWFVGAVNKTITDTVTSIESVAIGIANATNHTVVFANAILQKLENNNYDSQSIVTGAIEYLREKTVGTISDGYSNFMIALAIALGILLVLLLLYVQYVCGGHTRK